MAIRRKSERGPLRPSHRGLDLVLEISVNNTVKAIYCRRLCHLDLNWFRRYVVLEMTETPSELFRRLRCRILQPGHRFTEFVSQIRFVCNALK